MPSPRVATALQDHPSRLFVEITSRCNLRCPMCVKQSGLGNTPDGDMAPAMFEALAPTWPHLQALVLNGIGEPLLHPRLEAFIRTAKRSMPAKSWIGFQSNGHLLTEARSRSLVAAGLDRIFLSVDSTSPEQYREVRGGGNLGHVERALAALAAANREHPAKPVEVGAEFVIMRDNMRELPRLITWLAKRGVSRLVVSHLLPFGPGMADQPIFGINTESSSLFYSEWAKKAQQERIDIAQYFNVLWKFKKNPEERRLIEFVQKIVWQACQNDIPFHIGNLIAGEDMEQAAAIMEQAKDTASRVGLQLTLPSLQPLSTHTCFAIKHGGMFIAWDGKVSPCHFLWRSFSCHLYGREKQVAHKVFGDLNEKSALEIWNEQPYLNFRQAVLDRRYPHCPGCNVYPCEDIDSFDFENDCYGERVPCGDCPWNMGLLQCMGQEDTESDFLKQNVEELTKVRAQLPRHTPV